MHAQRRRKQYLWCWIFVLPTTLFYAGFQAWPILSSFYYSMLDWSGISSSKTFVGLANGPISLDINNDIVYKEAHVNGCTGRLMYQTWYDCQALLESGRFDIEKIIGGVYPMESFEEAFQAIKRGTPGKMLLIP